MRKPNGTLPGTAIWMRRDGVMITNQMSWPSTVRMNGVIEWQCEHGIGHPVGHVTAWREHYGVHGCDGCCQDIPKL